MQLIQAARRLYNPPHKKLPLPTIVELNRRLVKGYTHFKDDPRIERLKKSVLAYNKQLFLLGVRDHQVEYATFTISAVVFKLFYRVAKLAVMALGTLPGLVLFSPVFIATKVISIKKSREALAASTVKLQGRDVMATWKLLVAMAFAPSLYALYTILLMWWVYNNRVQGYVPEWVSLWMVFVSGWIVFPAFTFAALRFGETGMDILKSLRPLILSLNPTSANTLVKLRQTREFLSKEVTETINELGPDLFPDFESTRLVADPYREGPLHEPGTPRTPKHTRNSSSGFFSDTPPTKQSSGAGVGEGSSAHGQLPRNESLQNLSSVQLFASRPPSRNRSRTGSGVNLSSATGTVQAFSTISSKESLDEVSKKIRGAMRARRKERRRKSMEDESGSGSWTLADDSGRATPESSAEEKKEI